jgi:hypothetical protein
MDPTRSAEQRRADLDQQQQRRRRRGFLLGLLAGQVLIIALDLGGGLFLRTHPNVKIQAPIGVPSIVFLGMAGGAALLIVAIALIAAAMALSRRRGAGGLRRVALAVLTLGVTIGVIIGTAWFMIPQPEWTPTIRFAQEKGLEAVDAAKATLRAR